MIYQPLSFYFLLKILLSFVLADDPPAPQGRIWAGSTYFSWEVKQNTDDTPAPKAVDRPTFPFFIGNTTLRDYPTTYLAQQFGWIAQKNIGYLGLQPRPDKCGRQILHGVFSTFVDGAKSTDAHCGDGADSGPGVSCAVDFETTYGSSYNMTIRKVGDDSWSCELEDSSTGKTIHVGSYEIPAGSGMLQTWSSGFLEYIIGSPEWTVSSCSKLPKFDALIGPVYTEYGVGAIGSIEAPYEQGALQTCKAPESGFSSSSEPFLVSFSSGISAVGYGQRLNRGFVTN